MTTPIRRLSLLATAITTAAGLVAGAQVATAADPGDSAKGTINPTFERTIGGPGHAGLYAWGMATGKDGNVIVGDYWNYRVLRYSPAGAPLGVLINNSGNGANQYYTPYGLGVDPRNGDVYMADTDRYTIDVYSAGGSFLRSWGAKGTGAGKFLYPSRVVVNSLGTVFVADTWDHNIVMSNTSGAEIKSFGGFGSANGQMRSPHGLAIDGSDNLYVVDPGNYRIQVFDKNGTFLRKWGSKGSKAGQFQGDMRGIAVDKARGWVYVVDGEANRVNKYDLNGNFITRWGSMGAGPGQFADGGREITVDNSGNVWVADMPNFRVQKFSPTGQYLMSDPNPPQLPPAGGFNAPRGVAVAKDGTVAVSDTYNWRIQTFSATGAFQKQWGKRGRGPYLFNYARAIASNPVTNDWVITDTDNGRIVAYTKDGTYKWGSGEAGTTPGKFKNPQGLAVANNGNIYVADSNNYRVQVLNSNGGLVTTFGTNAQFSYPKGIAIDPVDQSVWVADSAKAAITHWSASGAYLGKLAIGRGTADNQLSAPYGIAIDKERVYVADVPTHKVKVWTKSGAFVTKIAQRGYVPGKLFQPATMAIYNGRLYIMEEGNERVSVFNLNAK